MELSTVVGTVSAALAVLAAVRTLVKGVIGDWGEFSRRRLKHAKACLDACAPASEMAAFAQAACDEETGRQLLGSLVHPRVAAVLRALYVANAFTLAEIRLAVRELPYDAEAVDDKRNVRAARWDLWVGALQSSLGFLLIAVAVLASGAMKSAHDQLLSIGSIAGGLVVIAIFGRMAFRGKHQLDAIRRVAAAIAAADRRKDSGDFEIGKPDRPLIARVDAPAAVVSVQAHQSGQETDEAA